jgi:hypothetical protein
MQGLHPAAPEGEGQSHSTSRRFIMSVRKTTLILALAAIGGMSAARADSIFVGGERGWVDRPVASALRSEAVRQEYLAFRANPVAPDGGKFVGGEAGYIFPQHTYARVNGEWVCTDKIAHYPKPNPIMTDAERRLFVEQYPAA